MEKKNIFHLLFIGLIIFFWGVQLSSAGSDWASEAKELMNSGEYDKALDVINAALSSGESKDLCYVQRANVYKKMGEYQKAIDDYDKAISLNPTMPYYIAMKADVYILMGEYQKGIDLYDSALQKNLGYEPLVQSVKSSREEAYQKMKESTKSEVPPKEAISIDSENVKSNTGPDKNTDHTSETAIKAFPTPIQVVEPIQTTPPKIEWEKSLGGSNREIFRSIIQTSDGGYILIGNTESTDGDVKEKNGDWDIWVVKLSDTGSIEWQKCLGGSQAEAGYSIVQTSDGGYILTGGSNSDDGDASRNHGVYHLTDVWVVKLSQNGEIQWEKNFGGNDYELGKSIVQTSDGGYILTGCALSNDGEVSGNHGAYDIWIIKLDQNGNLLWQKCLGTRDQQEGESVIETNNGEYIIIGWFSDGFGDFSGHHDEGFDVYIVKLNTDGKILWQKCLGGSQNDMGYSIVQTSDNGYILTGLTTSNDGDVSGNHGDADVWVAKLTSDGTIIWQKCLGGSKDEWGNSIKETSDGGYILTGRTESNDGDVSGNHGDADVWVAKLSSDGTLIWQKCLGGSLEEEGHSITESRDNSYVLTGFSFSQDNDISKNNGNKDAWVVKLSSDVESVGIPIPLTSESGTGSLSLTTNPSSAQISLDGSLQSGQTPLTLSNIPTGSHTITFSKSGYMDVTITVTVIPDETSEFSIALSPDLKSTNPPSNELKNKEQINTKESQGEDLIVSEITMLYYKSDSKDLNTDLSIQNTGTASAMRFSVAYFLSLDQIQAPFMDPKGKEIILGHDDINTLSAGESRKASSMKTFSLSNVPPGTYWFGVFVDSQNSVAEVNEENNVQYWEEKIKI